MNFIDLCHVWNILNIFQIHLNEYAKEVTKFHGKPETMDSSEKSHHITSNLVPLISDSFGREDRMWKGIESETLQQE